MRWANSVRKTVFLTVSISAKSNAQENANEYILLLYIANGITNYDAENAVEMFRYLCALTVILDVVRMPPVGGGGGGGAPDELFLFMECEFVSGTNGRATNRSRSCMYAFIKISNFSSMSAT